MKPLLPLAVLATALLLAGCTGGSAPGSGPAEPETGLPGPLLALGCEELLSTDAVSAAFGEGVPERAPHVEGYGGFFNVTSAALVLAGATRCAWGDGDGPGDHYLELELLPHAAADFARWEDDLRLFQPQESSAGDRGWLSCRADADGDSCRADVLAGDVWVSTIGYGLDGTDAIGPVLEAVATAASEASGASARTVSPIGGCDALLPIETVRASAGDDLGEWGDRGAVAQPVIRQAAFERAGGVLCSWRNGFDSSTARTVELAVLPDAEAVFGAHFAAPVPDTVTQGGVEGGVSGLYDSPFRETVDAYASLLVGTTWVDVWVNDEGSDDDRERALELAAAVALP